MESNAEFELNEVICALTDVDREMAALKERRAQLLQRRHELEQKLKQKSIDQQAPSELAKWSQENYAWSEKLRSIAKDLFGIESFRELQLPCMNVTLSKKDCILIIPTGGGKSLTYQLTAAISEGWTLVISPLISLMEDQVMSMQQLGIDTRLLSASTDKEDSKAILTTMIDKNSTLKLLYVTPERLAKSKTFMNKLEKANQMGLLARIAIDECHCCSQWGHDFRPDYKFLGILKSQFPGVPILCLTATASTDVVEDVKQVLNLSITTLTFRAHFNRPNLFYEVLEKPGQSAQCYDFMCSLITREFPGQSGIIYCLSKKDSEEVCLELQKRGIKAGIYHADINPVQRSDIHKKWMLNKLQVVVATIAFGLGIDKANVRFVIHHSLSKSLENYYQESGRCGRDGQPARCILLYRLADVFRVSCMVFHERNTLPKLYAMMRYAQTVGMCRRRLMAEIFMEKAPVCNSKCDSCSSRNANIREIDVSQPVAELLPDLFPTGQNKANRLTFLKAADKLSKLKSVKSLGLKASDLERIFSELLLNDLLKEDFHFTPYNTISYLVPTGLGARNLENGTLSVKIRTLNQVQSIAPSNSSLTKREAKAAVGKSIPEPPIRRKRVAEAVISDDSNLIEISESSNESEGGFLFEDV